ncbi:MAG: glycosyltransferase family 4 protein [Acidimicrobiales bacterium]
MSGAATRVALVCPYALSVPGGVQGQVLGIAGALADLGAAVLVVAPSDAPAGGPGDQLGHQPWGTPAGGLPRASGCSFELVSAGTTLRMPANGSRAPVALDPRAARRVLAAVRLWRPDVLHVHEPFVPLVPLVLTSTRPVPVVGTFHRSGASAAYRMLGPLARVVLSRIDDAVAVSDQARATLAAVVGEGVARRCSVVANGVDLGRFAGAAPWPTSGPTAVFVGRHERRKGLGVLLEAASSLPADARLWVLGSGPETAELRRRHGRDPRVEWCGQVGDGELARRVAGADVLVAPSLGGESFGVVLLEAMAAGTAVLASDIPGYRDATGGATGGAAQLVGPGDPAALASALVELLADPGRRNGLVARGRERAATCSFTQVAGQYLERYEAIRGLAR